MCVLDNTAQGLGQGKKQGHLEDSWHGAGSNSNLVLAMRATQFD